MEGRRTEKVAGGLTHQYIYDAEDIVEERVSGSSSDTVRFYHGAGIDEPLARTNSSSVTTYYLADHLGSIVQETNASGEVTLDREYDPWGVAAQGASTSGYAFTGREWDEEIGLYFYRARYYSPSAGRFLSDDPSGLADGPNLYGYVGAGPTSHIDPRGRNSIAIGALWGARAGSLAGPWGTVVGGVAGGVVGGLILADLLPNFWTESRPKGLPPEGVLPPGTKPGEVIVGPPSRPSAAKRGEKSLWKGK